MSGSNEASAGMIRTVHHLSATGGTVVCKLIAALEDVYLLSEIHPYAKGKINFNPTGLMQQMAAQYDCVSTAELKELFLYQLKKVYGISERDRRKLVIRDHAHSDYLGKVVLPYGSPPGLRSLIETTFTIKSIVTVRHPMESFLSTRKSGWLRPIRDDFDIYCARYLRFLDSYADVPLFKYEDVCADSERSFREICDALELTYDPTVFERFGSRRLTGDSGRGGAVLKRYEPKEIPGELAEALSRALGESANCAEISRRLGYEFKHYLR